MLRFCCDYLLLMLLLHTITTAITVLGLRLLLLLFLLLVLMVVPPPLNCKLLEGGGSDLTLVKHLLFFKHSPVKHHANGFIDTFSFNSDNHPVRVYNYSS